MQLSNILFLAGIFRGSIVLWSAPSGRLALRYAYEQTDNSFSRNSLSLWMY